MADNPKSSPTIDWVKEGSGNQGPIVEKDIRAGQTFAYGAPVAETATGLKLAVETEEGFGVALTNQVAAAVAGDSVPVLPFNPGSPQRFLIPLLDASGDPVAAAASFVGNSYSFVARSDGNGYGLDTTDTTNTWFFVEELDPRTPAGTARGRAICRVLAAKVQTDQQP